MESPGPDEFEEPGEMSSNLGPSSSPHRPSKRRKLCRSSDDDFGSDDEEDLDTPSHILDQDQVDTQGEDQKGIEQSKSKSKYKIHIPKNAEIPTDAFFTQPPERSSSPYRIDQFHWKKPRNRSPTPKQQLFMPPAAPEPNLSATSAFTDTSAQMQNGTVVHSPTSHDVPFDDEFSMDESYENILADLPSDAFSPPGTSSIHRPCDPILLSSLQDRPLQSPRPVRLAAPLANLRQTTLFGTQASEVSAQTQSARKHNWPLANREEPPTHHKLDQDALKTWVYPTNLGTIRDYQYSIVARGLYHNMLVALPTGLGKTFIAATIMLNWFRWTTDAQIVFVAPTKPLVSQQVKACFEIAGIPRSATTMLTGGISPGLRAEEWHKKRVFFMTPQTIMNDLKSGICDPKKLVLLVVDEAHRATGGYAYVEVVKFLRRFNTSFRVLALTATPGASIEGVQEVIDGLGISRIEIRTEESLDIRQYVHSRKSETVLFDNSDEMVMVMDLFSRALQPVLDKLNGMNAYWAKDPMTLTPYGLNQARQRWMASDAGGKANFGIKGMVNTIFSLLASLSHGIELLKFHGIGPFYHKVLAFRNEIHSNGKKGSKYSMQINESEPFQTMMSRVQIWINNPHFIGHPKLEYLQSVVMNHFLDAGEGRGASDPSSTKVMIFAHYRDSAEEIARVLRRSDPVVRPHVFVGQANSKGSEGMDQKKQLSIIEKFQSGIYNTLVATSIGEEGLDIGEVDLIICYDASASPIRMLQRMGRTGRKRAGNIVVTLMRGKEENNFIKAKDTYEKMQSEIAIGTRFSFHDEESRRIVPKDIQPVVDKRIIEIPPENTQPNLPEPTKRGRGPKKPPKKFHMPDDVRTGFVKASRLRDDHESGESEPKVPRRKPRAVRIASPEPVPSLDDVLLTASEEKAFERKYLDIQGDSPQIVEVPRNDAFPKLQRFQRPTRHLGHGRATLLFVDMLKSMHSNFDNSSVHHTRNLTLEDKNAGAMQAEKRASFFQSLPRAIKPSQLSLDNSAPASTLLPCSKEDYEQSKTSVPIEISSSNEDVLDGNLSDLIDDEQRKMDAVSSTSTSPPLSAKATQLLYHAGVKPPILDLDDSEDELPDFGALVQKIGAEKANGPSQPSEPQDNSRLLHQRGWRKILRDDSDED
jgi:ATP-dependent DNA helicase MPH1